ncbi:MAG: short-chain dehydrogenase [Phototrophicales bacterium]|nr:MAG: short-chain dehydrogenase [Phototrophicales bacterium]
MSSTKWTAQDIPDLSGKVMIVTGGNSGLGYWSVFELARKGAHVIMTARDMAKGEKARQQIVADVPSASIEVMRLDLADLSSVRAFAESFGQKHAQLDVLMNNAGVMAMPRRETKDGFEMQFGTNHLGHFALTGLLFDHIVNTPNSRVVTVSSGAHTRSAGINFDDLMGEREYGKWAAYSQSKLANLLFAYELQRLFDKMGVSAISVGAHPGYAATNLQNVDDAPIARFILKITNRVFAQDARQGALSQLYAATAPDVRGGDYVGPTGLMGMRGTPGIVKSSEASYDEAAAKRLWEVSEQLTGIAYPQVAVAS